MNAFKLLVLSLSFVSIQAQATTAILCGDLEKIEDNDNAAIVHLIFESPEDIHNDLRVFSKGKPVKYTSAKADGQTVTIELAKGKGTLKFATEDADYSNCQGDDEDIFAMEHIVGVKKNIIKDCRCWQD
ncbi:MAG TPA: hypothetical protein VGE46_02940 [Bdellovibrio sp.]